jgi:hypothetical protein
VELEAGLRPVGSLNLNYYAPLCSTGYGIVGQNLLAALDAAGVAVSAFPAGEVDVDNARTRDAAARALQRAATFDHRAPTLSVFHQFSLAAALGVPTRSSRRPGYVPLRSII